MNKNRSDGLVVIRVQWEVKVTNAWLLREVFDVLLRDPAKLHPERGPDLTARDAAPTMQPSTVADDKGGES